MKRIAAALLLGLSLAANTAPLDRWPAPARASIEQTIATAPAGSYAVFDADNTIWRHDLEEALLPFLENKGTLSSRRSIRR